MLVGQVRLSLPCSEGCWGWPSVYSANLLQWNSHRPRSEEDLKDELLDSVMDVLLALMSRIGSHEPASVACGLGNSFCKRI